MAKIKLYTRNILESGAVSVTGSPDSGYPITRLYDRCLGFYWKDTVTEAKTIQVLQSTALDVDFLAIEGHNFDGEAMTWQYSDDGSSWGTAATWSQSGNGQIIKTLTSALNKAYWKVTVGSMQNPRCGEVFMSYGYEFQVRFDERPIIRDLSNLEKNRSFGGVGFTTKYGEKRRTGRYALFLEGTDITNFDSAMDDLDDYLKPFYFKDHDGNYWLASLEDGEPPEKEYMTEGHILVELNVVEEL